MNCFGKWSSNAIRTYGSIMLPQIVGFTSIENMQWVKEGLKRNFVMALKGNRKVAISAGAKQKKE